ncbi:MAG TPA: DsbA family protein [Actinomycetales bacterium]|nr:DsbA family protein [Actinomycetales bacterium]
MVTVTIWSDIHCPWAGAIVHRLRTARDAEGLDVVLDPRPWPLELVNGTGTPYGIVTTEIAVLAQHEPAMYSRYRNESWPSTFMPAFELVAAARRVHGDRGAEEVDYALRRAFLRAGVDVSVAAGLRAALEAAASRGAAIDVEAVLETWRTQPVRADVLADYERSKQLPIQGSPQVFLPDGTTEHNPGLTDHEWRGGIPRVMSDDREAPLRLLRRAVGS